ncbi:MaoC family dehydratase N-terminal domain-containing protein [soil metagenome]
MTSELIGRTGTPFRVVVEEGKVREFARATDSTNPDHLRDDAPVSPLTFLISSVFWQDQSSSVWAGVVRDYSRILHGGQSFTFHRPPPRAGEVLTGQQRIADVYTKEGKRGGSMEFTEVVTEFRDPDGELVVEMTSTTIVTSVAPTQEG